MGYFLFFGCEGAENFQHTLVLQLQHRVDAEMSRVFPKTEGVGFTTTTMLA